MSLSAKKYFLVLRYIDCNDCEFYHPDTGYCEKVGYQKKPHDNVCRAFALCQFAAEYHDLTEAERTEFNQIYKKSNENA